MEYKIKNKKNKTIAKGKLNFPNILPAVAADLIILFLGLDKNSRLWLEVGGHCFTIYGWQIEGNLFKD